MIKYSNSRNWPEIAKLFATTYNKYYNNNYFCPTFLINLYEKSEFSNLMTVSNSPKSVQIISFEEPDLTIEGTFFAWQKTCLEMQIYVM